MAKFEPETIASLTANETSTVNLLNTNFDRISEVLEQTLSRDGTFPNTMNDDLDMNSQRILHLPEAVNPTEPVRKAEFDAAIFGSTTSDFTDIYKDMLDALITANPIESQFGGVGDGTTDDTAAVQAAVDFVIAAGGGTVLLTHPHRITAPITNTTNAPLVIRGSHPDLGYFLVDFTAAAYPTGAAAIDFLYDESYNNNSVLIDSVGFKLSSTSGNRLNTAIKIHYTDRLNPSGAVSIVNCRISYAGSAYWLKGIHLDTAPQSRLFDNIIFGGGGGVTTDKVGYGIQLGTWAQGTMVHRNSIRGMEFAIYCGDDSADDPTEFQAEGVSIRWNKAQSCNWAVGLFLSANEIAWTFTDNDFDCAYGSFWIRNLLRFLMSNNTDGWINNTVDHCGVLLEYDTGTEGDYALQGIQGQISGGYSLRRGDIDFDVVGVSTGATTTITYANTATAKTVTNVSVDGDGAITLTLNNTTRLRNKRRIQLSSFGGMTQLNGNTYRIGDLDTAAKTIRLYQENDYEALVDGSTYTAWTSGGEVALLYSTGVPADGDKIWIDRVGGTDEINNSPYILQDVNTTLKTARLTSYYDGTDVNSSSWGAYSSAGNLTRYGRAVEVRGGKYLSIDRLQVFERNVGLHLWPETSDISWRNPTLIPTGPNLALSILNESNTPGSIVTDDTSDFNDGNAPGNGVSDDTVYLQTILDEGGSLSLNPQKNYLVTSSLVFTTDNQGVEGNGATITMSTASGHFSNNSATLANRIGSTGTLFSIVGTSDSVRLENPFVRNLTIVPDAFVDDRWLTGIYLKYTSGTTIQNVDISGFSRGTGVKADNNNGARFLNNRIHDFYTATTTASSQLNGFEIDGDSTQLTDDYGLTYSSDDLLFDGNTVEWLTCSNTSRAALGWQADAFSTKGHNGKGAGVYANKPTRNVRFTNNNVYMVAEAFDTFGIRCIFQGNNIQRVLVGFKFIYGASNCTVDSNTIADAAYYAIELNGTTASNYNPADGNIITKNQIKRVCPTGDWWADRAGTIELYDYSAAGNVPYGNGITRAGVRFTIPASTTDAPQNTLIEGNIIDCGYTGGSDGLDTRCIFHESTAGGSSTQRAIGNIYLNYAAGPITDTALRIAVVPLTGKMTPHQFGADPTGVASSTAAFNAMFTAIRAGINATLMTYPYEIDLDGGIYLIDGTGINATNMRTARNITIRNGTLYASGATNNVIDLTGSRWFHFDRVHIYGDPADPPNAGWFLSRLSTSTSAAEYSFDSCDTTGYFNIAGLVNYASETNSYVSCRFWNSNPSTSSYGVVLMGHDGIAVSSDFQTITTGAESFIENTFVNCEFRRVPANTLQITGITKANPAVITYTGTDPTNGDVYWISDDVGGMVEMYGKKVTVANVNAGANTFECSGLNSSGFTTYTSGGSASRGTGPAAYITSGKQLKTINSYAVAYNEYSVVIDMSLSPGGFTMLDLDLHLEGVFDWGFFLKTSNTASKTLRHFRYKDNNPHATKGLFYTDATSNPVLIHRHEVELSSPIQPWTVGVFSDMSMFTIQDRRYWSSQEAGWPDVGDWATFPIYEGEDYFHDRDPRRIRAVEMSPATDAGAGVTCNGHFARIVSQSLTTVPGASTTIAVTCPTVVAGDIILASRVGGTSTNGIANVHAVAGAGSYTITISNCGTANFNGTVIVGTQVIKVNT